MDDGGERRRPDNAPALCRYSHLVALAVLPARYLLVTSAALAAAAAAASRISAYVDNGQTAAALDGENARWLPHGMGVRRKRQPSPALRKDDGQTGRTGGLFVAAAKTAAVGDGVGGIWIVRKCGGQQICGFCSAPLK